MEWKRVTNNSQQISFETRNGFVTISLRFQDDKNPLWKVFASRNETTMMETPHLFTKKQALEIIKKYMKKYPQG